MSQSDIYLAIGVLVMFALYIPCLIAEMKHKSYMKQFNRDHELYS